MDCAQGDAHRGMRCLYEDVNAAFTPQAYKRHRMDALLYKVDV